MSFTSFRLKFRRFIRKYKKIIFIIFIIWLVIFMINRFLISYKPPVVPQTTYEPHVSIMNSGSSVPKKLQESIEELIDEYVNYCNEADFSSAYKMLSNDCKEYVFHNNFEEYRDYILNKYPTKKEYSIQDYSNIGNNIYIYEVKFIDNILATGLTNSTYTYIVEKMAFKINKDKTIDMSIANFIYYTDIKNISENDYLKIDVLGKRVNYSIEEYQVKFTNRSDYTIVIADNQESNEIILNLPNEYRNLSTSDNNIVLYPKQSLQTNLIFSKFVDDNDKSQFITLNSVRVMEKYSGTTVDQEIIKSEIENAVDKFSMQVSVEEE